MEEKILVEGKFSKFNVVSLLFLATAIFCFIFLIIDYNGRIDYNGQMFANGHYFELSFLNYFLNGWVFECALGWFVVFCSGIVLSVFFYFFFNRCQITVTDKRVFGKMNLGLKVDLPFDKISFVASGILSSLVVATSSNRIFFWMMKNKNEVHQVIKDVLIRRQETETIIKQEAPNQSQITLQPSSVSVADEILKFKNLLDMGAITQEEFEKKKSELLG